jgi:hypothetical protein
MGAGQGGKAAGQGMGAGQGMIAGHVVMAWRHGRAVLGREAYGMAAGYGGMARR